MEGKGSSGSSHRDMFRHNPDTGEFFDSRLSPRGRCFVFVFKATSFICLNSYLYSKTQAAGNTVLDFLQHVLLVYGLLLKVIKNMKRFTLMMIVKPSADSYVLVIKAK